MPAQKFAFLCVPPVAPGLRGTRVDQTACVDTQPGVALGSVAVQSQVPAEDSEIEGEHFDARYNQEAPGLRSASPNSRHFAFKGVGSADLPAI